MSVQTFFGLSRVLACARVFVGKCDIVCRDEALALLFPLFSRLVGATIVVACTPPCMRVCVRAQFLFPYRFLFFSFGNDQDKATDPAVSSRLCRFLCWLECFSKWEENNVFDFSAELPSMRCCTSLGFLMEMKVRIVPCCTQMSAFIHFWNREDPLTNERMVRRPIYIFDTDCW